MATLFQRFNTVYTAFFKDPRPTRTTVVVAKLVGEGHIEITTTARKRPRVKAAPAGVRSTRIAAIDWMRGLVMVLMVVDHASMAFDGTTVRTIRRCIPTPMTWPCRRGSSSRAG